MMFSIIKCFVIAITLVTEMFVSVSAEEECEHKSPIFVECANADIENVPQDCDANIEILNISYTCIRSFQKNDFQKYLKLKILDMKGLKITSPTKDGIPETIWAPLTQLEYLDVSGTSGEFSFPKKLPSSIKYLHVNEFDKTDHLDLSTLDKLVELHMAQSTAKNLPKLNKNAPLMLINLLGSDGMNDLHYNQISSFCLLKTFMLDHHTQLTQPAQFEQCCGILAWVKTYNIEGVDKNLHCFKPCTEENNYINSDATYARHDCLVRHGLALNRFWINILIGLLSVLAISFLAYLGYRLFSRPAIDQYVANTLEEEENLSLSETSEDIG